MKLNLLYPTVGFVILCTAGPLHAEKILYKDATQDQADKDMSECQYESIKYTQNREDAQRLKEVYTVCMQSKGYQLIEESEKDTMGWYNPALSREKRLNDYAECEKLDPTRNPASGPDNPNSYGSCLRAKGYSITSKSDAKSKEQAKGYNRLVSLESKPA